MKKKLKLNTETIRSMTERELYAVAGGVTQTCSLACPGSVNCSAGCSGNTGGGSGPALTDVTCGVLCASL